MEDANKPRQNFLSLSLNLGMVFRNPTPGESAYILTRQVSWNNRDKRVHFLSDVFAAVAIFGSSGSYFQYGWVHVRRRSHLILGLGARVRYQLFTIVNTPFFKYPRERQIDRQIDRQFICKKLAATKLNCVFTI